MTKKETLLASSMLDLGSEAYANHGCNDWNFPADWTVEEKTAFVRDFYTWNGSPQDFDPKRLFLPDWAVMAFLAHKLKEQAQDGQA